MKVSDKGGGDFKQAPEGTYGARCIRIVDIGSQHGEYLGVPNVKRQLVITWEIDEEMEPGKPFITSKFYTASLGEKAGLRKDLMTWRGRDFTPDELAGFDINNLLDKTCLLNMVTNKNGKVGVGSIVPLPKGMTAPAGVNEQYIFDIEAWDDEVFEKLGKGMKELIMKSDEGVARSLGTTHTEETPIEEDDIPFS